MENNIYDWLMEKRNDNAGYEEARLFALIISSKAVTPYWTLEDTLGLTYSEFKSLFNKYFPYSLSDYKEDLCFKIHFHFHIKNPFVCHCCAHAVTSKIEIRKVDVPLFYGYPTATNRKMEVDDLRELFFSHRTFNVDEEIWFAKMLAVASLGEDHLWQDLGVTGRFDVSYILKTYFTELFRKNNKDMKWKKFFYKQLCDLEEIKVCKAPSCSVCDHYANCFGPEDSENWTSQEVVIG